MIRVVLGAITIGVLVGVFMGLRYATPSILGRAAVAGVAGIVVAIVLAYLQRRK